MELIGKLIINQLKRSYCVKINFGHFWPTTFCPIPALYTELIALYLDICVFSSNVPETYVFDSP